jgi:hypothetical protein
MSAHAGRDGRKSLIHFEAGCYGKLRFATDQEARAHAAVMNRHKRVADHQSVYKCKHCEFWHIGTKSNVHGRAKRRVAQKVDERKITVRDAPDWSED